MLNQPTKQLKSIQEKTNDKGCHTGGLNEEIGSIGNRKQYWWNKELED